MTTFPASAPVMPGMTLQPSELGDFVIHTDVHSSSRKISARWAGGMLKVVVYPGCDMARLYKFLADNIEAIQRRRPTLRFHVGQTIEFTDFTLTIGRQELKPKVLMLQGSGSEPVILVGSAVDMDTDESSAIISRMICHVAKKLAPGALLPRAREIADALGLKPSGWKISTGHKTLGQCSSRGVISLSAVTMLLPPHLRDYIIYHELAHLTHLNHSAEFHALCDRYCGGRERRLIRQLKSFQWPIIRN